MGRSVLSSISLSILSLILIEAKKVQISSNTLMLQEQLSGSTSNDSSAEPVVVETTVHGLKAPYHLRLKTNVSQNESDEDYDDDYDGEDSLIIMDEEDYLEYLQRHLNMLFPENWIALNASMNASNDTVNSSSKIEKEDEEDDDDDDEEEISTKETICQDFSGNRVKRIFNYFRGENKRLGAKEKSLLFDELNECFNIDLSARLREGPLWNADFDFKTFVGYYRQCYDVIQMDYLHDAIFDYFNPKMVYNILANWGVQQLGFGKKYPSDGMHKMWFWKDELRFAFAKLLPEETSKKVPPLVTNWRKVLEDAKDTMTEEQFEQFWPTLFAHEKSD